MPAHGQYGPPQHGHGQHGPPPMHEAPSHNPWSMSANHHNQYVAPAPVKPEGWYSPTQQYTAPAIHYASAATEPTFAVCEFGDDSSLELAQLPHHPIYVRGSISADAAGETFYARINTKGKMGDSCDAADTGAEFNPLFETDKYGNPNPYQDSSRGRIPDISASVSILESMPEQFASTLDGSDTVMQNLEGTDSLIGRSITLFDASDDTIVACCVIGRDMAPMVEEPEMPEPMPMPMPMHDEPDMPEHEPHGYNPHHGGHHYDQPQYEPRHFRPEFNH